jgi:sedoheptulose-bisphosphatase
VQIEKAGGHSSCDGLLVSGLDVPITAHDQRTQICYGSKAEVQRFEEYVYGQSPRFAEVGDPRQTRRCCLPVRMLSVC